MIISVINQKINFKPIKNNEFNKISKNKCARMNHVDASNQVRK